LEIDVEFYNVLLNKVIPGNIFVTIDLSGEISANLVTLVSRVARWNIFKPKIPMGVNFGGS
jgi:hypothetical protein